MDPLTAPAAARAAARAPARSAPGPRRALVFVGFMGAGKTSAARAAAAELGVPALDSDRELERELGEPIEAFFDRAGEAEFRRREEEVVVGLLGRPDAEVVALGGGSLGSERVREALVRHLVVHLEVSPDDAWRRASGRGRPLARDRGRFDLLYADRRAAYEAAADATLPAADRGVVHRALPALLALRDMAPGRRLIWARAAHGEYPVLVGRGLLREPLALPAEGRRFVVSDETVARLHPVAGDWQHAIPPGEGEKTLARAEAVLRAMARAGVARGDVVVAVGGGVVGDLAGFCAAVYQRGIRWTGVPTSLVAQVDSAYGGKTGVDLPEAKNYAGAFHQPSAVHVDPAVLATLPPAEVAAGYAEIVKTALIAGGPLWARVRDGAEPTDERIVIGCLRTKLAVVAEDERDDGRRQVLNLGHTVGHALEAASDFRLRHGEAVALGLLAALRLSGREALREEVAALLAARGLPLRAPAGLDADVVVELAARDKKRRGAGPLPFVLVEAPGDVTHGNPVGEPDLRAAVAEIV